MPGFGQSELPHRFFKAAGADRFHELAPLPGCAMTYGGRQPVVSLAGLRSTTGYRPGRRRRPNLRTAENARGHSRPIHGVKRAPLIYQIYWYKVVCIEGVDTMASGLAPGFIPGEMRGSRQGPCRRGGQITSRGTDHAGGVAACSRWLSEATPPVRPAPQNLHPVDSAGLAGEIARLFRRHSTRAGRHSPGHRRGRGSCAPAGQPQNHACAG